MGRKVGEAAVPLLGGTWAPSNTMWPGNVANLRTKWHLDPSSRLATIDTGRKIGGLCPFGGGHLHPIRYDGLDPPMLILVSKQSQSFSQLSCFPPVWIMRGRGLLFHDTLEEASATRKCVVYGKCFRRPSVDMIYGRRGSVTACIPVFSDSAPS